MDAFVAVSEVLRCCGAAVLSPVLLQGQLVSTTGTLLLWARSHTAPTLLPSPSPSVSEIDSTRGTAWA
jgi:hypothetical protein